MAEHSAILRVDLVAADSRPYDAQEVTFVRRAVKVGKHPGERFNNARWLSTVDDLRAALAAAEAERDKLARTLDIRERSQIPMVPRGAQKLLDESRVERDELREALRQRDERVQQLEEALGEAAVPLEVLYAEIPYFRLWPWPGKIRALSPALQEGIARAVYVLRAALAARPEEQRHAS